MTGTTDIARRPNGTPPAAASAALAVRAGQEMWTDKQRAALVSLGIPQNAAPAELAVFMHQCQRTGLDPFTRQIYLIYRREKQGDKWVSKPTTQVGIDGYRLIRDRIAKREGLRVEYEPTVWYDADGGAHEAWLWDEPPAACKVAILIDGRRFSSTLRFREYAQYKDRDNGVLNAMWRDKSAHMIEKCAEADVLRRAFPQDLSGLLLTDEAPADEYEPPVPERQRVTAAQARARHQTVQGTAENVPPAQPQAPPADPPAPATADSAGGTPSQIVDENTGEVLTVEELPDGH